MLPWPRLPLIRLRVAQLRGARGWRYLEEVGRGIALAFGEAGATVYCTGRSSRAALASGTKPLSVQHRKKALPAAYYTGRPETIEETAELVTAQGGKGIPVVVDHLDVSQVEEKCGGRNPGRARKAARAGKRHFRKRGARIWQDLLASRPGARVRHVPRNAIHTHIITSH